MESQKCVVVMDGQLPVGLIANTSAILGITLGRNRPEAVGEDVRDRDGQCHPGIIQFPVPILKGSPEIIREIREKLRRKEYEGLFAADFSDLAQGCETYETYIMRMSQSPETSLRYLGIVLCGEKRKVNRLTGSLPLLR